MTERSVAIASFLKANGWCDEHRRPLSGDASFRRYERLTDGARQAVFMDAPPDNEDVRPFWGLSRYLNASGYSAPKVEAGDSECGALLLEDFGDSLFSQVVRDQPEMETPLYEAAVDVLIDLHQRPPPEAVAVPDGSEVSIPIYDDDLLMSEAELIVDWYLPAIRGSALSSADRRSFEDVWRDVFHQIPNTRPVLVLRDYHADNLIWLPDRVGIERVGLLDFQDAVAGHPAYDLVSLLEDARRDVPAPLAERMIDRYIAGRVGDASSFDAEGFRTAYAVLGAQRNTKIIGIFMRLWKRDGKPGYIDLIPRVWGLLEKDILHPALSEVRRWLDVQVPAGRRTAPFEAVP